MPRRFLHFSLKTFFKMIETKDFISVHLPKTGGSFITQVIRHCYTKNQLDLLIHRAQRHFPKALKFYPVRYREHPQHTITRHFPGTVGERKFVMAVRDPVSTYRSGYFFGWWRENKEDLFQTSKVKSKWPHWPDLSLDEYCEAKLEFANWKKKVPPQLKVGPLSAELVHYITDDPQAVWKSSHDELDLLNGVNKHLLPMHFLRQSRLQDDLESFLSGFELQREPSSCPSWNRKVNASRKNNQSISPELEKRIRKEESLFYKLFPDLKG